MTKYFLVAVFILCGVGNMANAAIPPATAAFAPALECECESGELIVEVGGQFYSVSFFFEKGGDAFIGISLLRNVDGLFEIVDEPIDEEDVETILILFEKLL